MQNSVWFSIGSVVDVHVAFIYTRFLTVNLWPQFCFLTAKIQNKLCNDKQPPKRIIRKLVYSFFDSLFALHKSHKTKYVGLVCGGKIVSY